MAGDGVLPLLPLLLLLLMITMAMMIRGRRISLTRNVMVVTASMLFQPCLEFKYRYPQADYAGDAAAKAAAAAGMAVQTQAHGPLPPVAFVGGSTAAGDKGLRGFCRNRL